MKIAVAGTGYVGLSMAVDALMTWQRRCIPGMCSGGIDNIIYYL